MKITKHEDKANNETVYTLRLTPLDITASLDRMTGWDRRLIAECQSSTKISDTLLGLELIARKREEAHHAALGLDNLPKP